MVDIGELGIDELGSREPDTNATPQKKEMLHFRIVKRSCVRPPCFICILLRFGTL